MDNLCAVYEGRFYSFEFPSKISQIEFEVLYEFIHDYIELYTYNELKTLFHDVQIEKVKSYDYDNLLTQIYYSLEDKELSITVLEEGNNPIVFKTFH